MKNDKSLQEMKLDLKLLEGNWYKYPGYKNTELKIRHYDIYSMNIMPNETTETLESRVKQAMDAFMYSVMDWRGIKDKVGNVIKCNEDTKRIVADLDTDLAGFVLDTIEDIRNNAIVKEKEAKNLGTSQVGEIPKKEKKPAARNV